MRLEPLNDKQIGKVYRTHLKKDFPRIERKPLFAIRALRKRGAYECLGAYEGEALAAYVFLAYAGRAPLIDYLAVVSGGRGAGVGSAVSAALSARYAACDFLLAEVERAEAAESEEERAIRVRRIGFYEKNGWIRTGQRVDLFGADMEILALPLTVCPGADEARRELENVYRVMFPWALDRRKVKFP